MDKPCCIEHWVQEHPRPAEGVYVAETHRSLAEVWDDHVFDLHWAGVPATCRAGGNTTWTATTSGVVGTPATAWGGGGGSGGENSRMESHLDTSSAGTEPGRLPGNHGYNWHRRQWETTGDLGELAAMLEYPLPDLPDRFPCCGGMTDRGHTTTCTEHGMFMVTEKTGMPPRVLWGIAGGLAAFWLGLVLVVTALVVLLG